MLRLTKSMQVDSDVGIEEQADYDTMLYIITWGCNCFLSWRDSDICTSTLWTFSRKSSRASCASSAAIFNFEVPAKRSMKESRSFPSRRHTWTKTIQRHREQIGRLNSSLYEGIALDNSRTKRLHSPWSSPA